MIATSPAPFRCPDCGVTYQPHWRAPGSPFGFCLGCHDRQAGRCRWPGHPVHDNPCSYGPTEKPGEPCRYCGDPVPANGKPCPTCWIDLTELPLADLKALLAADGTFHLVPRPS